MQFYLGPLPLLFLVTLPLLELTSCAATLETKMEALVPAQRVLPPSQGRSKVYVEFQDQTGEGASFEDRVYDAILEKVEERGYEPVPYEDADYVLWATLRLFDQVGTEEGNHRLAALGGIVGGVAAGVVTAELTDNATLGWMAALGAGGFVDHMIERLSRTSQWAMVVDIQLGRRLNEEAMKTIRVEDKRRVVNGTVAGVASGVVGTVDIGAASQSTSSTTEIQETTVFLELEQRVVAQATARRKSKEEIATGLTTRLADGLAAQLPRNRSGH